MLRNYSYGIRLFHGVICAMHSIRIIPYLDSKLLQETEDLEWSAGLTGQPSHHVQLLPDANLVVQDENDKVLWESGTSGAGNPDYLLLRGASGQLKIVSVDKVQLWVSHEITA